MKKQVGLWIDHRGAFIVIIVNGIDETLHISSGMESRVRYSSNAMSEEGLADDQVDRQFDTHLQRYYDNVISHISDAESILLMGPGEAKGEFKKQLEKKKLDGRVVAVETVDKMTDYQIAAKVRHYYHCE